MMTFTSNAQAAGPYKCNRAMWVWYSLEPMQKAEARKELFDFCAKYGINEIFFQLQYAFSGDLPNVKCQVNYADQLHSFIKDAHKSGIKVHSLDGYPEFVLRPNHPQVLAQVGAVLKFNSDGRPEEAFDGIHLDNEPYLVVGFDGVFKDEILEQFIELNKKCVDLVRSSGQKVVYGIDIPFWFDELYVKGDDKSILCRLLDIVDNIGVMDYRNFAEGQDGIIAHGMEEVKYASEVGKKVYIGVDTLAAEPERVIFIYGHPEYEFNKRLTSIGGQFAKRYEFRGFKIKRVSAGGNMHIGLAVPPYLAHDEKLNDTLEKALSEVERVFGKDVYVLDKKAIDEMMFDAEWALSKDGEFDGFKATMVAADRPNMSYLRFESNLITLPKITFAGMTKFQLETALGKTEEAFKDYSGFYGFAIHHYRSYKAMKDK